MQVDAQDKLGIRTQLIMCFLRDMSAESAMATLEQSLSYKDWIVGVVLDSDNKGNPPVNFKAVFVRARAEGCAHCTSGLPRMCWAPSGCTVTTRRCRCWRRARPTPHGPGCT